MRNNSKITVTILNGSTLSKSKKTKQQNKHKNQTTRNKFTNICNTKWISTSRQDMQIDSTNKTNQSLSGSITAPTPKWDTNLQQVISYDQSSVYGFVDPNITFYLFSYLYHNVFLLLIFFNLYLINYVSG